ARQLPDKAVALLDTACARVAIGQAVRPAPLEDCLHRIAALQIERQIAEREARVALGDHSRLATLDADLSALNAECQQLTTRWQQERELIDKLIALRGQLQQKEMTESAIHHQQLADLQRQMREVQGDTPLLFAAVDASVVAAVVADWTGIPLGRMVKNEIEAVLNLTDTLSQRVVGQRHALELIAKRVRTSRARLDDPHKPVGVFLLCGPSGVGKTETALALAESLYGGEQNLITINMSEFQEAHSVSTLKGAPPGYIGYGEGGVLTEAVRRRPYSVLLLDEIEKAHPDVHEIFFQVFDKGWMEDGEGRHIDFRNTIIILTSNTGSRLISTLCADQQAIPAPDTLSAALRTPLLEVFPAALLGRLLVVPYYPLNDAVMATIVTLQLRRIQQRLQENHGISSQVNDDVIARIVQRCTEVESGGRTVDAILTNTLLPQISQLLLSACARDESFRRLHIGLEHDEFCCQFQV
ncbi:AAA family ATPase, partial [Winslowiella iniecta]